MVPTGPVARRYHDLTAHSPDSVRASGHELDWENKPFPFKVYTDIPGLHLPREIDVLATPALAAIGGEGAAPPAGLTLAALTSLLYYMAGVTKRKTYAGGGEVLFRAAASTGALYQTEVYVVAGTVEGLPPGVHHFCPGDFTLRRLRSEDARAALAEAAADATPGRRGATLVLTGLVWRNSWKYRARTYRHLFWDGGTMLANALATAAALGLAPRLFIGFVDAAVHRLLGIDGAREVALALLCVGPETTPAGARLIALPAPDPRAGRALGETIQRRGSTRSFAQTPLGVAELGAALWATSRPVPGDVPTGLVDIYMSAHAVEGLPPGTYLYRRDAHALDPLDTGEFRRQAAFLCLEQPLGGDAAATLFFLSPLDAVLAAFGERGYRLVNLEAGLAGGRAYLAAYALGFGASGLTFYDAEVVRFFLPRAAGADAIFVTALGRARGAVGDVLGLNTIAAPTRRS